LAPGAALVAYLKTPLVKSRGRGIRQIHCRGHQGHDRRRNAAFTAFGPRVYWPVDQRLAARTCRRAGWAGSRSGVWYRRGHTPSATSSTSSTPRLTRKISGLDRRRPSNVASYHPVRPVEVSAESRDRRIQARCRSRHDWRLSALGGKAVAARSWRCASISLTSEGEHTAAAPCSSPQVPSKTTCRCVEPVIGAPISHVRVSHVRAALSSPPDVKPFRRVRLLAVWSLRPAGARCCRLDGHNLAGPCSA
jgi:hypothetical protein